jgi:acyl dehydratase
MKLAQFTSLIEQEFGGSDWILIDQSMVDAFADLTDDHQFIHVDPVRARETDLGGTIAHGFLILSLIPRMKVEAGGPLAEDLTVSLNYGLERLRFIHPVLTGRRVRGRFHLKGFVERKPDRFQRNLEVVVEIEGEDRPALVAEWLIELSR